MQQLQNVINRKKLLAFKLIAILLPFILTLLLEAGLHLVGYGHDLSLFIPDEHNPGNLVMNPHISERYFTQVANATIGNNEPFKVEKAKGTIRIFVLGESTTLGYPYMHNGSFHRWLKYRLMNMYPDVNFEIVNLSLTAVNSYTVLDMAKELQPYLPDAVFIYSGHNEYYGALGIGSTSRFSNVSRLVRTMISLKRFRTMQLILNIFQTAKKNESNRNLMERMAGDQHIPYGSEKFKNGIRQFNDNMDETCRLLSEEKIPVFISNLVSNDRDLVPLANNKTEGDISATILYQKGLTALSRSDSVNARQLFIAARDHDMLRFRAPEEINTSITRVAAKYPGVYLVNSRRLFEEHSIMGIMGKETLLEHVHPNLLGYSLMSEGFFQALQAQHVLPGKSVIVMSLDQLQREMPLTKTDSLFGAYSIIQLKMGWPFNEPGINMPVPSIEEEKIAMDMLATHLPWNNAMDRLMSYYNQINDLGAALKVAEAVVLEYPEDVTFYVLAGRACLSEKQYFKAINYLGRAFKISPSLDLARTLYALELKIEKPINAMAYLDYAIRQAGNNAALFQTKNGLAQLIALQQALQRQPGDSLLRHQVKMAYQNLP